MIGAIPPICVERSSMAQLVMGLHFESSTNVFQVSGAEGSWIDSTRLWYLITYSHNCNPSNVEFLKAAKRCRCCYRPTQVQGTTSKHTSHQPQAARGVDYCGPRSRLGKMQSPRSPINSRKVDVIGIVDEIIAFVDESSRVEISLWRLGMINT